MLLCILACIPLTIASVEAIPPETSNGGVKHVNVTVMGRQVLVYRPDVTITSASRFPALIVLHGSDAAPSDMINLGFEMFADSDLFLAVYPDMHVPRSDDWGYQSDVPFFQALLERLEEADFAMDPSRASICGHSAGGTMALFLQNNMDAYFQSGAAVEAAVGHLRDWNMSHKGSRTMVVWNHADPVLHEYAPVGGEPAYYNLTVSTLRRHGSKLPASTRSLPTSSTVPFAKLISYPADGSPELTMLSFESKPGTHQWWRSSTSFDATRQVVLFLLGSTANEVVV